MSANYRCFPWRALQALTLALSLLGCSFMPLPPPAQTPVPPSPPSSVGADVLVIGTDDPLLGFGGLLFGAPGSSGAQVAEIVHAYLSTVDADGNAVPRLAAALPSLDDGTWQVQPDGTMTTIYRLRAGLRWHDDAPFTAQDVVFGYESRLWEAIGPRADPLHAAIQSVRALDDSRVEIAWRSAHWRAGALRDELVPLPRHLLEGATDRETGGEPRYWTDAFVGLGPYRVARFTPGEVELAAFAGYAQGAPQLPRLLLRGYGDAAGLQAAVIAGAVGVALSSSWAASAAIDLRVAWEQPGAGTVLVYPRETTYALFRRDRLATPTELQRPALRRALAVALNRQQTGFTESLGLLPPPVSWIPPSDPRWEDVRARIDDPLAYDPARAFRLLAEDGWQRTGEGDLRNPQGQSLTFELASLHADATQQTVARYWSEVGVRMNLTRAPVAPAPGDRQPAWSGVLLLAIPTGLEDAVGLVEGRHPTTASTMGRDERTLGAADALAARLGAALRPHERWGLERELVGAVAAEQPIIPLGYRPAVVPVARGVVGPQPRHGSHVRPWNAYNIHEWRVQR